MKFYLKENKMKKNCNKKERKHKRYINFKNTEKKTRKKN